MKVINRYLNRPLTKKKEKKLNCNTQAVLYSTPGLKTLSGQCKQMRQKKTQKGI